MKIMNIIFILIQGVENTIYFEPIHFGDIKVYIENALEKEITQGELVFALEGIYLISALHKPVK